MVKLTDYTQRMRSTKPAHYGKILNVFTFQQNQLQISLKNRCKTPKKMNKKTA